VATAGRDFFRIDRSGATKRRLLAAGVLVGIGGTALGAHLVHRVRPALGHVVSLVGGLVVLVGLLLGLGAVAMLVFENVYLLLGEEGVVCHDNGKETTIPWAELEDVRLEEEQGYVVLERTSGEALRWFAGRAAKQIHARIQESKRKALHGLLHASN